MLKIYDEFLEDETILALKPLTYKLHVSALIYCSRHLTDGAVTSKSAKVLQIILGYPLKKHIAELVDAGVWVPLVEGGHVIRNYLEFNPNSATVKQERAKTRERMRKLREQRAGAGEGDGEGDGEGAPARAPEGDGATPSQPKPGLSSSTAQAGQIDLSDPEGLIKRLVVATGVRSKTDIDKIMRTVTANKCSVGAMKLAIDACTGPGVRDPLAVALSELKKRRAA